MIALIGTDLAGKSRGYKYDTIMIRAYKSSLRVLYEDLTSLYELARDLYELI